MMAHRQRVRERLPYNISGLIGLNVGRILWVLLTVSVGLQQFPSTEPAAFGVFWISAIVMVIGSVVWVKIGLRTKAGFTAFVVIQISGVIIQIAVLILFWDVVWVPFDEDVRKIRTIIGSVLSGNRMDQQLLPMRLVWVVATLAVIYVITRDRAIVAMPRVWHRTHD